jgi:DNA-binding NtrC family response regulator
MAALRRFDWTQSRAAQYLGLSRKTLIYRMGKFRLRRGQEVHGTAASR